MFSKKEKPVAQPSPSGAKRSNLDTVIGAGAEIIGDLKVDATARIDGRVKGNVVCKGDLSIGTQGEVEGEVKAGNLILAGRIKGKVIAEKSAELSSTARMEGDISCGKLVIEEGAFFQGHCEMRESQPKQETTDPGPKSV